LARSQRRRFGRRIVEIGRAVEVAKSVRAGVYGLQVTHGISMLEVGRVMRLALLFVEGQVIEYCYLEARKKIWNRVEINFIGFQNRARCVS